MGFSLSQLAEAVRGLGSNGTPGTMEIAEAVLALEDAAPPPRRRAGTPAPARRGAAALAADGRGAPLLARGPPPDLSSPETSASASDDSAGHTPPPPRRPRPDRPRLALVRPSRHAGIFRSQDCPICLEPISSAPEAYRNPNCEHVYHRACFTQHVEARISDGMVAALACPLCPRAVTGDEVEELVSEEAWQKYQRFRRDLDIAMDEGRRHCPTPGCSGVIARPMKRCRQMRAWVAYAFMAACVETVAAAVGAGLADLWGYSPLLPAGTCAACALLGLLLAHPRAALRRLGSSDRGLRATCPECQREACFVCGQPWHEGYVCVEARDSTVEAWAASRDAERCPRCGTMIERNAGCNHMTCRRGFGGCGFQFCWLCREEYLPGHFGNGRCPQYGGAPDYDFFRSSHLLFIIPFFVLLSGVLAAEVFLMPLSGAAELLWLTALGLAGLVCPNASKRRQTTSRPLAAALGGPVLGALLALAWLGVRGALGGLAAAAYGLTAMEATGLCADPPPSRGAAGPAWRKRLLWYILRRVGGLVLVVACVASPAGLLSFLAWRTKSIWECNDFVGCLFLFLLRVTAFFVLMTFVLLSLALGGATWRPGLGDAVSPVSWWMGSAGVARIIGLAALLETIPIAVDGFFHTSDWALMVAAWLFTSIAACRCAVAVFWWRRSSWPLPWLAVSAVWGARLCLELLGHMQVSVPDGLCEVMVFIVYVAAGLLAGTAACRQVGSAVPQLVVRLRQCFSTPRRWAFVRLLVAVAFVTAAYQLERLRQDPGALFAQRIAACGVTASVLAGCVSLQLLPDGDTFVPAVGGARQRGEGAAPVARV